MRVGNRVTRTEQLAALRTEDGAQFGLIVRLHGLDQRSYPRLRRRKELL
jgi:hypothetical protein